MTTKEVHKIALSLKKASALESPFKVPKTYFDEVENEVVSQLNIDNLASKEQFNTPDDYFDTIEDLVISKLKAEVLTSKTTNNAVPENYFDTIEDQVIEKLEFGKKKSKVISLSNFKKLSVAIAVAASLLLIFNLGNQQEVVTFENLALSELEYAVESNLLDYDSETLLALYPEVEASLTDLDFDLSEDSNLESYLYETDLSHLLYE